MSGNRVLKLVILSWGFIEGVAGLTRVRYPLLGSVAWKSTDW
jgi:hypothetical protein